MAIAAECSDLIITVRYRVESKNSDHTAEVHRLDGKVGVISIFHPPTPCLRIFNLHGDLPSCHPTGHMPQQAETGSMMIFLIFDLQVPSSNVVIFKLKFSVGAYK